MLTQSISRMEWNVGSELPVGEIAEALRCEGVIVLRGIAPTKHVAELRQALIRCLKEDARKFGSHNRFFGVVHALMTRGEPFFKLLKNPVLRGVSRAVLGHGCIVNAYNSSSLPPRCESRDEAHSRAIHVDCPRWIDGYITNLGWVFPLDPFTAENGAMEILPQGFTRPDSPTLEEFECEKMVLDNLSPGDAVCFNARCWHRSGVNVGERWRHAATLNITRAYIRQQFDYPRMMEAAVLATLSEDIQQFLGCHVRMPVSLEEFHLPPDERPYRPHQE